MSLPHWPDPSEPPRQRDWQLPELRRLAAQPSAPPQGREAARKLPPRLTPAQELAVTAGMERLEAAVRRTTEELQQALELKGEALTEKARLLALREAQIAEREYVLLAREREERRRAQPSAAVLIWAASAALVCLALGVLLGVRVMMGAPR